MSRQTATPAPGRAKAAGRRPRRGRAQLARIRGTYDDIVHERDELKAGGALQSEARVAATGSQLQGDWEARYKTPPRS